MDRALVAAIAPTFFWWWACMLLLSGLFLHATQHGGVTWDESDSFFLVKERLTFASNLLSGVGDGSFRSIPYDWAFYGLGTLFPAYAAAYLVDVVLLGQEYTYDKSFSLLLHLIAFICALGASWYTSRIVYLSTGKSEASALAALTLLLTPVWIGYGFFDYKDVPVAAGLIAAVYYAALFMEGGRVRSLGFFFAALLFLGTQKVAAVPLALPACIGVAMALVQLRSVRLLAYFVAFALAYVVLLYLVTPPSWKEPIGFLWSNLAYMSQHAWNWCTITAGQCIGRNFQNGEGYSASKYLGLWYAVQLPILLQVGLLAAMVLFLRSFRAAKPPKHLIVASFVWPIAALAVRNSTLYDGIRHTLFLVPLAVSFVFVNIPEWFWSRWRLALVAYGLFLLIDIVKLQPYGYVWFNEWARFFANETNYETDHWGYSLKEAASLARRLRGPNEWIVGHPSHLVAPFVSDRYAENTADIPAGSSYLHVSYTKMKAGPPSGCTLLARVERRQILSPRPVRLAFVARCPH